MHRYAFRFSIAKLIFLLSAIFLVSNTVHSANDVGKPIYLEGWLKQEFSFEDEFLEKNMGNMHEVFDEYVGSLIDSGLDYKKAVWLKPTYGNQNLLWVLSSKIGDKSQTSFSEYQKTHSQPTIKYYEGTLKISREARWRYSGYVETLNAKSTGQYQDYTFTCTSNTGEGVSVFYWGNEMLVTADKNESLLALLRSLESNCQ